MMPIKNGQQLQMNNTDELMVLRKKRNGFKVLILIIATLVLAMLWYNILSIINHIVVETDTSSFSPSKVFLLQSIPYVISFAMGLTIVSFWLLKKEIGKEV